ncbi:hypothetical protein GQ55_7G040900 [Panicum hallii var. hallii]|uniref:Uncharacterized protein n=1 Tax=Panicum hallii var. hallii TaxID=1504633 RepID=A0A2T7CSD8_9POAL|nr:hypothetical protein GQ55_7G040900 [Panicum hallii var. hallii]
MGAEAVDVRAPLSLMPGSSAIFGELPAQQTAPPLEDASAVPGAFSLFKPSSLELALVGSMARPAGPPLLTWPSPDDPRKDV